MAKTPSVEAPLHVLLFEARPNKLFTDEQTAAVRFLRYSQAVPCAECGKRSKHHWTVLYSFKATSMVPTALTVHDSGQVHLPLTPVCRAHLLAPAILPTRKEDAPPGRYGETKKGGEDDA